MAARTSHATWPPAQMCGSHTTGAVNLRPFGMQARVASDARCLSPRSLAAALRWSGEPAEARHCSPSTSDNFLHKPCGRPPSKIDHASSPAILLAASLPSAGTGVSAAGAGARHTPASEFERTRDGHVVSAQPRTRSLLASPPACAHIVSKLLQPPQARMCTTELHWSRRCCTTVCVGRARERSAHFHTYGVLAASAAGLFH